MLANAGTSLQVLLVEDSPGDVRLTREAFRDANPAVDLHAAFDGVEAMAFLLRQGVHESAPRRDPVLLDLNLPKMDGREVPAHIKENEDLKTIPTVQLDQFEALVESINDFWLTRVKLPNHA